MIREWSKFKGWSVLEYFILHPDNAVHVNGLARLLKISPSTVQQFCTSYFAEGILEMKRIGNLCQYRLNRLDARAVALKKFIGPYLVADEAYLKPFLEKNKNVLSVSIYGSFASGEYGSKSDLDIFILVSDEKRPKTEDLASIELKLGREIGITTMSLAEWRSMERKKDSFFLAVKKNNLFVWGSPI